MDEVDRKYREIDEQRKKIDDLIKANNKLQADIEKLGGNGGWSVTNGVNTHYG